MPPLPHLIKNNASDKTFDRESTININNTQPLWIGRRFAGSSLCGSMYRPSGGWLVYVALMSYVVGFGLMGWREMGELGEGGIED